MTISIKEILRAAAQSVGVGEEVESYLSGGETTVGKQAVELLLRCFERVENELALDYLPLIVEEEIVSGGGQIAYSDLRYPVARVLCVEDEWGQSVKYKLFPDCLETSSGKVKIVYAYAPAKKGIDGVSEYKTVVSERLLHDGVAAEYSLAVGELTAAGVWDKKYKDGIRAAYKATPCKRLRSRRWI